METDMERKYELTPETKRVGSVTLRRVRALIGFGRYPTAVKPGDSGGWVESERNLSHVGTCWLYSEASAYGDALVSGDARVVDSASVSGSALVEGSALVASAARVYGNGVVRGNAMVFGSASVYGNGVVEGTARVFGQASVCGDGRVSGSAGVYGSTVVSRNSLKGSERLSDGVDSNRIKKKRAGSGVSSWEKSGHFFAVADDSGFGAPVLDERELEDA
jgi:hypothetical protein